MKNAEVVVAETQAVAPSNMLEVIAAAARDPQVDPSKLGALLELKERIDAKQAEMEFNRDYASASAEMPTITKDGMIDMGSKGKIPFATYEALDRAIRPIERKYGFSRAFLTEPSKDPGILMTVKLLHRSGHSMTSTRQMPPDPGPGRNAMQAIGSAGSYARRYLTLDIWALVTIGADDDANKAEPLTLDEINHVYDLLAALELSQADMKRFLNFAKAESVEGIQRFRLEEVLVRLREKLAAKEKHEGS